MSTRRLSWLDVIEDLPAALRFVRAARGCSLRDVAAATGVSAATLNRVEMGKGSEMSLTRFAAVVSWLADGTNGGQG